MKSKVKHWIHLKRGLLYVIFSRNRELVEKAAAGYRGLIWRRSPADPSWLGRLCPWLKGSSTLEVFGIDCSKLHHKPPWRGMFSLFHLMKAGKANWHNDWACWEVKSPTSFRNPAPSPSCTSHRSSETVCYGAYGWWWVDGAAASVMILAVSVKPRLKDEFVFLQPLSKGSRHCGYVIATVFSSHVSVFISEILEFVITFRSQIKVS